MENFDRGNVEHARQDVILHRRNERVSISVIYDIFEEASADALNNRTDDLSTNDQRIDHASAIVEHDVTQNFDCTGLYVDLDEGGVDRVAPRRRGDLEASG